MSIESKSRQLFRIKKAIDDANAELRKLDSLLKKGFVQVPEYDEQKHAVYRRCFNVIESLVYR